VTERDTFDDLDKYVDFLKEGANPDCHIVLVGTKLDLEEDENKPRQAKISFLSFFPALGKARF